MINKVTQSLAGIMYLYGLARQDNPENELFGDITPSEASMIIRYSQDKGLHGIEEVISEPNPKTILEYLCDPNMLLKADPNKASTQISLKDIKKNYVIPVFKDGRLQPEELKLIEGICQLEGHITEKNLENFYKLIEGFTKDRKLYLMIQAQNTALMWYVEQLNEAGFHTCTLHTNLKDGKYTVKDQNEKERPNMIIVAPYSYPPHIRKEIIENFSKLDKTGAKIPRLAIEVEEKDLPRDFNVHAVLHEGAKIPAMIEAIADLYKHYYLEKHENGRR